MPGPLAPLIRYKVLDSDGAPVAGARFYAYLSGTSTPQATYSDSALTTPHTNPVVADAGGVLPPIYFAAVAYRVTITDTAGATIYAATDNVYDFAQLYGVQKDASGNVAVAGTLGVTGATTLSTLGVTGATTLSTLGVTGATTLSTLGVTGATTLAALTATTGAFSGILTATGGFPGGLWTPTDTSGAALAFTGVEGSYVKIGQLVVAAFKVVYPSTANGLDSNIGSLPFSGAALLGWGGVVTYTTYATPITILKPGGNASLSFYAFGGATVTNANLSLRDVRGLCVYRASA